LGTGSAWPPIVWAGSIFITSTRHIRSEAFVHTVSKALPVDHSERAFGSFWQSYWWFFVKGWHFSEFAILFLLTLRALRQSSAKYGLAMGLCIAYAASDEFHQTFIPGRGGNLRDVLIDCSGIMLAFVVTLFVVWRKAS
jgi:hypothetical protein